MKTHSKYSLAACLALLLAAAPAAFARGDETDRFMQADTDGDGYVSSLEANTASLNKFNRADTNHDGKVTADELDAERVASGDSRYAKMSVSDWIAKADTNGDGVLSLPEATAATNEMFAKMDTDGDGKISKEECQAFHDGTKRERNDPNNPNNN